MRLKVLELFAGYGSQHLALTRLGIETECHISEIDKYAIRAYNQLHGETFNYGDICKIDETKLPQYDLITYSSPCQDFSVAGKQQGGDKDSGTRSSLLWECERIIKAVKPKYLLMENVKNLVGKKHKHNFDAWLKVLDELGYDNYWQVLNAKDYGIPQNRERVFVVSIRKDLNETYTFPPKKELKLKFKDFLESEEKVTVIVSERGSKLERYTDIAKCLLARDFKGFGNRCMNGVIENNRVRKLTPKEHFRLMGVKDVEFDKLQGISNTQLYKMAGNSIVVKVLEGIFGKLFLGDGWHN
jgi:DNA (cytosine-5)-methyltransferase 1